MQEIDKIPKIIHYCWFGDGQMSEQELAYIETWKKHCPDYTIIKWSEANFDINVCQYARDAAKAKKWSFVTDYVRLSVLYEYGGFYFDTDVELLKSLEPLRKHRAFIGFEQNDRVNDGQGMGAVPHHEIIRGFRDMYHTLSFYNKDGSMNLKECPQYRTMYLRQKGLELNGMRQTIEDMEIYPKEYFCPKNFRTGKLDITENTYSIHHFKGSWHTEKERKIIGGMQLVRRVFGEKTGEQILQIVFRWKDELKNKK